MTSLLTLASALVWLAASAPGAGDVRHEVRPGETLASLAKRYYGSTALGEMLGTYNGLAGKLEPGTTLRLPSGRDYVARAGDSWSHLAETQLGDAALAVLLAELNGSSAEAPLRIGQQLTIPVLVDYRVAPGDSFARIARRFYGGPDRAGFLQRLNRTGNARWLQVGQLLRVPLTQSLAEPPAPESDQHRAARAEAARPGTTTDLPSVAVAPVLDGLREELRRGMSAYSDGSYDTALERLEPLRAEVMARGSLRDQRELLRHLAFAYVAYGRTEEACSAYRALMAIEPSQPLDPDRISPKIREVLAGCGGG